MVGSSDSWNPVSSSVLSESEGLEAFGDSGFECEARVAKGKFYSGD